MRIVIPDDYNQVWAEAPGLAPLRERAEVVVHTTPAATIDEVVERLRGARIVVANRERTPLKAEVFDRLPDLELIAQTGRRGQHLDLAAATERGILVAGTGGSGSSTAELAIGLILAAMKQIPFGDAELRAGRWSQRVGRDLNGKLLGIIGLGRIGSQVARVGAALGMRVCAWGPTLTPERAAAAGVQYRPLEDVLRESDVVSVHLQLSPLSRGLLDREKLALLKPSALFVNTARAAIADEAALVEMLSTGRLWGAALDVYMEEPLPPGHPLARLPNVVLTPHVGWVSESSYERFVHDVVENILAFLDGREPPGLLNPAAVGRRRSS